MSPGRARGKREKNNMPDNNQLALLELLKASLWGTEPHFPAEVDWDAVLTEAKAQTVVSLAAPAVPETFAAPWKQAAMQDRVHFMRVLHEQTQVVKLFEEKGIPLVILKGSAAAMYYPVPERRTMGDIDFLVPQERFEEACRMMEENGYRPFEEKGARHQEYEKNGIELELHRRVSSRGLDIDPLLAEGLIRAERAEVLGHRFPVLPSPENGLVLLNHVRQHLRSLGLGLRQILDWMLYVHAAMRDGSWEAEFLKLARETGLETLAVTLTGLCQARLGLPDRVSWCALSDAHLAEQLLEQVFDKGNFGRKQENGAKVENTSAIIRRKGLFRYLQAGGIAHWKAAQRWRVLRPFAWLYQILYLIYNSFTVHLSQRVILKRLRGGKKKNELLERLGLLQEDVPPGKPEQSSIPKTE